MKIKVSSSYTGVISRGAYENARPGFVAEAEFDYNGPKGDDQAFKHCVDVNLKTLQKICYDNFKGCEEQAIIDRIHKERADIRFYPRKGFRYPSVTSVIGFDADMYCSPEDLAQYAAQSNLCHAQVAHFIETGKWEEAKDVPGTWTDLVIVTKGPLKLETNGWSFPDFLKKYPIKEMKNTGAGFNDEYKFAGTPDFIGIPDFEGAEKVLTLFDVKRTPEKVKNFKQMAAYSKLEGYEVVKQICIVPLNNKTQQGFSKPTLETRIDQYFDMFLKDREAFKNRFGV